MAVMWTAAQASLLKKQVNNNPLTKAQGTSLAWQQNYAVNNPNTTSLPTVAGKFYSWNWQGGAYGTPAAPTAITPIEPMRAAPTVATKAQPVISKTFTNNLQYDDTNPEDYLMRLNARVTATGKKPSEDEYYNALKAQQAITSKKSTTAAVDPYQGQIASLNAQKDQMASEYKAKDAAALDAYKTSEQAAFEANKTALEQSWAKELSAAQNIYSFSWFGRSTAAADKASEIQAKTNAAVNNARLSMEAQVALKNAELRWASAEELKGINDQIAQYQKAANDFQIDSIKATAEANQKSGNDYMTSLNNLMNAASASGINIGNPEDIQKYAQIARNADWTINEWFIKALPENVQVLIRSAAQTSQAQDAAKTVVDGSGKTAQTYQWNPKTNRYDIPVGGWVSYSVGWVWWGWAWGWAAWQPNAIQTELITRLARVKNAVNDSNLPRSAILLDPNYQADLAFIKANMTFETLSQMKKDWVKLGVLSDSDIRLLGQSALTITPGMDKTRTTAEVDRLITSLGWVQNKSSSGWSTNTKQPATQPTKPAAITESDPLGLWF